MRPLIRPPVSRDAWIVLGLISWLLASRRSPALASGAISAPRNDDFAYRRAAITLYETGRLVLTGWAVMTLVGQLVATLPFLWVSGGSAWAFAATGAIFAVAGIVASYSLARRLPSPWMGRICRAARGPSPGIHGLHDVLHDRGAGLRHGDVVPGDRGRGDPSIAGGASLALAGRIARGRVLCVQHPGIRHCRTDRRTRCRWRVGSPGAQAPRRHRARRARGRVRRHLRVHLEPARPGEPGLERAHAGDHPEGPGRCRGALARPRAGAPGRRDDLGPALVAIRRSASASSSGR